jgi:TonB family protein
MNAFAEYLLKANVGLCLFLVIYVLLLKRETDFRFNRGYLLGALLVSALSPLFHFSFPSVLTFNGSIREIVLPEVVVRPMAGSIFTGVRSITDWLWIIYLAVIFLLAIKFTIRLFFLLVKIYRNPRARIGSLWLLESADDREVFSFFNFVFIGNYLALSSEEKSRIIRHEAIHTAKYHSVDILLVNLLGILFWFNPLMRTYRKLFVQLHEFEADARSVESHEVDDYCDLLAKVALKSSGYQLANHFSNSLTLKRIEMMKKMKTRIGQWKMLFVASAAFAFCYFMVGNDLTFAQAKADQKNDETIYTFVEKAASFGRKKDFKELYQFFAKTIKYPEEAKSKRIEGKVFVKFVIEKDGSVTNCEIVKGINELNEEALRAARAMPKWRPGRQGGKPVRMYFTLPINFDLSEPQKGD